MRKLDTGANKMKGTWAVRIELENKLLPEEHTASVLFWLRGGTHLWYRVFQFETQRRPGRVGAKRNIVINVESCSGMFNTAHKEYIS